MNLNLLKILDKSILFINFAKWLNHIIKLVDKHFTEVGSRQCAVSSYSVLVKRYRHGRTG